MDGLFCLELKMQNSVVLGCFIFYHYLFMLTIQYK